MVAHIVHPTLAAWPAKGLEVGRRGERERENLLKANGYEECIVCKRGCLQARSRQRASRLVGCQGVERAGTSIITNTNLINATFVVQVWNYNTPQSFFFWKLARVGTCGNSHAEGEGHAPVHCVSRKRSILVRSLHLLATRTASGTGASKMQSGWSGTRIIFGQRMWKFQPIVLSSTSTSRLRMNRKRCSTGLRKETCNSRHRANAKTEK